MTENMDMESMFMHLIACNLGLFLLQNPIPLSVEADGVKESLATLFLKLL